MFRKFSEYLDSRGQNQEKPIIDPFADTAPKPTKAPEKAANKGKSWENKAALSEKPEDYAGPGVDNGQQMQPKGEKNGKALDQEGDAKLIYEPKIKGNGVMGGKEIPTWPKSKTEQFLHQTRDMTLAEFASYIASQNKAGDNDPIQAIRNTVSLANENNNVLTNLIWEFKRSGNMDRLVAEMFKHQETFKELTVLMADENGATARRLVRALNEVSETTAPPATADDVPTGLGGTPAPGTPPPGTPPGLGGTPPQPARKPVRSIGANNQMDLSGGANITASPQGSIPPPGASGPTGLIGRMRAEHNLLAALAGNKRIFEAMQHLRQKV